jgi:serine/threonine-protein kinase HipA
MKKSYPKKVSLKRYVPVESVEVLVWGRRVGVLALDSGTGFYAFAYEPKFLNTGIELCPIHMPLAQGSEPTVFFDLPERTYRRLPAFIADSLPDDFGNALIDGYMATRGIAREQITALDRLAYMGSRGMGALEFHPNRGPRPKTPTAIDLRDLVQEAREVVSGTLGRKEDETWLTLRNLIEVGTSAGGARAKAVVAWNRTTNQMLSGQTVAPEGFEQWLLKFDGIGTDKELGTAGQYGRIEYAYFLMARAAGIKMSDCHLLEENGRAHFMTKRFDRDGNRKHHMQTLCAINHIDYKKRGANTYEQLFLTIGRLGLTAQAFEESFRRMVFNILAMNCDDHSKNFSFILPENGSWTIAPFYDVSFAHNPNGEWTKQHLMSANGVWSHHTRTDLITVADRFGIPAPKAIIEEVTDAIRGWPRRAKKAGVTGDDTERILAHLIENCTRLK